MHIDAIPMVGDFKAKLLNYAYQNHGIDMMNAFAILISWSVNKKNPIDWPSKGIEPSYGYKESALPETARLFLSLCEFLF
jgi:hypothetical protein